MRLPSKLTSHVDLALPEIPIEAKSVVPLSTRAAAEALVQSLGILIA